MQNHFQSVKVSAGSSPGKVTQASTVNARPTRGYSSPVKVDARPSSNSNVKRSPSTGTRTLVGRRNDTATALDSPHFVAVKRNNLILVDDDVPSPASGTPPSFGGPKPKLKNRVPVAETALVYSPPNRDTPKGREDRSRGSRGSSGVSTLYTLSGLETLEPEPNDTHHEFVQSKGQNSHFNSSSDFVHSDPDLKQEQNDAPTPTARTSVPPPIRSVSPEPRHVGNALPQPIRSESPPITPPPKRSTSPPLPLVVAQPGLSLSPMPLSPPLICESPKARGQQPPALNNVAMHVHPKESSPSGDRSPGASSGTASGASSAVSSARDRESSGDLTTPKSSASPHIREPRRTTPSQVKKATKIRMNNKKILGQGTWGTVYVGLNELTRELIAVKEISFNSKEEIDATVREIRVMKNLDHPNVIKYLGAERDGHTLKIYMEYVVGGSLAGLIKNFGPVSEFMARGYVVQILEGLQYLHSKNIAHRDIKCDNLLVEKNGDTKLADFGQSKDASEILKTFTGTAYFMAPEVIKGNSTYTKKADIWSFGCAVIEMQRGQPPYSQYENQWAAMYHITNDNPEIEYPERMSSKGRKFLSSCLLHEPTDRWNAPQLLQHPWLACAEESIEAVRRSAASFSIDDDDEDDGLDGDGDFDDAPANDHFPPPPYGRNLLGDDSRNSTPRKASKPEILQGAEVLEALQRHIDSSSSSTPASRPKSNSDKTPNQRPKSNENLHQPAHPQTKPTGSRIPRSGSSSGKKKEVDGLANGRLPESKAAMTAAYQALQNVVDGTESVGLKIHKRAPHTLSEDLVMRTPPTSDLSPDSLSSQGEKETQESRKKPKDTPTKPKKGSKEGNRSQSPLNSANQIPAEINYDLNQGPGQGVGFHYSPRPGAPNHQMQQQAPFEEQAHPSPRMDGPEQCLPVIMNGGIPGSRESTSGSRRRRTPPTTDSPGGARRVSPGKVLSEIGHQTERPRFVKNGYNNDKH